MHQKILKKILVELEKDKPDLSYVRGMVEAIVDDVPDNAKLNVIKKPVAHTDNPIDEASVLDARAKAALETIKDTAIPE